MVVKVFRPKQIIEEVLQQTTPIVKVERWPGGVVKVEFESEPSAEELLVITKLLNFRIQLDGAAEEEIYTKKEIDAKFQTKSS